MLPRFRGKWRLPVCLCVVSLGLMVLYFCSYQALGQIPPGVQTMETTVGFSEGSYTIVQGQTLEIGVTLNAPAQQDVSIDYDINDETAKVGKDYGATSGTLTIPKGSLSGKITIPTIVRHDSTPLRTMSIALRSPSNARAGSTTTKIYLASGPDDQTCY